MRITKIISTAVTKGKLIVKILGLGSKDVQTVYNVLPFGIDSNPVPNLRALFDRTDSLEERILLGIILENAIAQSGETRIYATNSSGADVFSLYLKNTGIAEFGGNSDFAVRYGKLNDGLQSLKSDINGELDKIKTAITSLGGTYTKTNVSVDITAAKINNIKTS